MSFASENLTLGQMNAVIKAIGGELNALRLLRGELAVVETYKFPLWRKISLGVHMSLDRYLETFNRTTALTTIVARTMLREVKWLTYGQEIDLVLVTPSQLGLKEGGDYDTICAAALRHGYKLCHAEVGPALRLSLTSQPRDERILIGMETILYNNRDGKAFSLDNKNGILYLAAAWVDERHTWNADQKFVFIRPRT